MARARRCRRLWATGANMAYRLTLDPVEACKLAAGYWPAQGLRHAPPNCDAWPERNGRRPERDVPRSAFGTRRAAQAARRTRQSVAGHRSSCDTAEAASRTLIGFRSAVRRAPASSCECVTAGLDLLLVRGIGSVASDPPIINLAALFTAHPGRVIAPTTAPSRIPGGQSPLPDESRPGVGVSSGEDGKATSWTCSFTSSWRSAC
jgi:hypothetical protein